MTLPYKIVVAVLAFVLSFTGGFVQGQKAGREATLKAAVKAYQQREKINENVQNMDGVALCMALGGLRGQCADLLRGVHKTAESE